MTLTASPPITLAQVAAEFGVSLPANLASFVRGGAYVPDTGTNAAVPTALPIDLLDLLGASAYTPPAGTVALNNHDIFASRGVGIAMAKYEFQGGGACGEYINAGGYSSYSGEWLVSGLASSFDVRVMALGDTVLGGISNNTWQAANSTWSAKVEDAINDGNDVYGEITVELRPAGGGPTLDSCTITLTASRF